MRILLILLQTVVFLALLAVVLLVLFVLAGRVTEPESAHIATRAAIFVFGSLPVVVSIFTVVSIVNIWIVLGPLVKIDDPVRRTLQHLSLVFTQSAVLLVVSMLAAAAILIHFM
jgi:hypothetical protein